MPIDLIIDTTTIAISEVFAKLFICKKMAKIKVETAIKTSARIIIFFLLYLSAHTPAKGDIIICGKNDDRVNIVSHIPDDVCIVTYHTIAI